MFLKHESEPIARWSRNDVLHLIEQHFGVEERTAVVEMLDLCGLASSEGGRSRVQLCMLRLARGDAIRIRRLVFMALLDFRDVLQYEQSEYALDLA